MILFNSCQSNISVVRIYCRTDNILSIELFQYPKIMRCKNQLTLHFPVHETEKLPQKIFKNTRIQFIHDQTYPGVIINRD